MQPARISRRPARINPPRLIPCKSTRSIAPSPRAASSRPAPSSSRTLRKKPASPSGPTRWARPSKNYIIETKGSGVGLIDYDNDGWLDIYLVNGSTFDALDGKETPPHAALFHNNHDGTFTDVAAKAGVTNDRWGFGVAIADYDNDGWPDIFVSNWGKNRLYHNNHDGTFTDVAEKAGVALDDPLRGTPAPPGATTTATAGSISSSPDTSTTTGTTCPPPAKAACPTRSARFAARR